ncbi:MAG: response regulator [Cellvibrionaceae bacterium]
MQKVLIVEDSPIVAKILLHMAKQEIDHEVVLATTFAEARSIYEEHDGAFFAAIVDLNLPDAPDGEVVDFTLKNKIPTIVLTGSFDEERRESLLSKGIVDYVTKEGRYSYQYALRLINRLRDNESVTVLVVEDSSTTRNYITGMLRRHLFKVVEAVDGIDAIKVFLSTPDIKLLITDYNMPNMDGFELVKNLRCKYEKFDLIIIGLSAEGQGGLSAKFIKTGANDFLSKPFNPEEFYCRINHNIESLELVEKIRDVANRDYCTNVYSRRYFFQQGEELWQNAKQNNTPLALAVINLDNFKELNEQYGNSFADAVLKNVAAILEKTLFRFTLARSSGKEFYVLLPGLDNIKAVTLLDKVRGIVSRENFVTSDGETYVTCSIGVSNSLHERLLDQIASAEELMLHAKEAGKNIVFGEEDEEQENELG